jgi:hypothetical protein
MLLLKLKSRMEIRFIFAGGKRKRETGFIKKNNS